MASKSSNHIRYEENGIKKRIKSCNSKMQFIYVSRGEADGAEDKKKKC